MDQHYKSGEPSAYSPQVSHLGQRLREGNSSTSSSFNTLATTVAEGAVYGAMGPVSILVAPIVGKVVSAAREDQRHEDYLAGAKKLAEKGMPGFAYSENNSASCMADSSGQAQDPKAPPYVFCTSPEETPESIDMRADVAKRAQASMNEFVAEHNARAKSYEERKARYESGMDQFLAAIGKQEGVPENQKVPFPGSPPDRIDSLSPGDAYDVKLATMKIEAINERNAKGTTPDTINLDKMTSALDQSGEKISLTGNRTIPPSVAKPLGR